MRLRADGRALRPVALVSLLLLGGCAAMEQQGSVPVIAAAPSSAPRTVGIETLTSAEHRRLIAQFGGAYNWPTAEKLLNDILTRLAAAEDRPGPAYRVTILNTPVVNAFALPSGNIYVSRGLLALANDSAEVAAVMAHEIAHVSARHAAARAERERQAAVISQAASVIQNRQKGQEVEARQRLSFASFSRSQEIEADKVGVAVIARAGFDPYGASRFLALLGRSTASRAALLGQPSADKPDILATHPSTPERIEQATLAARQIGAPGLGASDKQAYLAAIAGMMFGEDPADGFVRGRKFIHPRLGFGFTAPENFALDNAQNALLGTRGGGAEALRLDSVKAPAEMTLETYLASGWIEGILASSIEAGTVNGMPAAFGTARAGEWNFRAAVIRVGADTYRLLFAARTLDEATERRFRAAIDSFHQLSPAEVAAARPLVLNIVTASAGQNAEQLAQRMTYPERPLDTFLLLNGLENAGTLKAGEAYKIVVD